MSSLCRIASPPDFAALGRMAELYQYELSDLWDQDLDAHGAFERCQATKRLADSGAASGGWGYPRPVRRGGSEARLVARQR